MHSAREGGLSLAVDEEKLQKLYYAYYYTTVFQINVIEISHTSSHTVHINREMYLQSITQLAMISHQSARNKKSHVLARSRKGAESKGDLNL